MRDIDALRKRLAKKGYIFIRRTKHALLMESPKGFKVLIPKTPGDKRSINNLNGQLERKENET